MRTFWKKFGSWVCCVVLVICLPFAFAACSGKTDKTLNLTNYSKYMNVSTGVISAFGNGYNWSRCSTNVSIKEKNGFSLKNVTIKYTFRAGGFENTVTESLPDLSKEYTKKFEFDINYEPHSSILENMPEVFVEVVEISGEINKIADADDDDLVFLILLGVSLAVAIPISIVYWVIRSKKIARITLGMTVSEVYSILGEPSKTESSDNVLTAVWQSWARRGRYNTYCTVTFKDGKVVSVIK